MKTSEKWSGPVDSCCQIASQPSFDLLFILFCTFLESVNLNPVCWPGVWPAALLSARRLSWPAGFALCLPGRGEGGQRWNGVVWTQTAFAVVWGTQRDQWPGPPDTISAIRNRTFWIKYHFFNKVVVCRTQWWDTCKQRAAVLHWVKVHFWSRFCLSMSTLIKNFGIKDGFCKKNNNLKLPWCQWPDVCSAISISDNLEIKWVTLFFTLFLPWSIDC